MAGDNVGSWFGIGTIGAILTGSAAAIVPFVPAMADYAFEVTVFLAVLSIVLALIAIIAFSGFLNLVVRNLQDLNEHIGRRY